MNRRSFLQRSALAAAVVAVRPALLALLFSFASRAENLYVRPGGAGSFNGTSWDNAFADFEDRAQINPETGLPWSPQGLRWGSGTGFIGPGDTLWVAGGTYGGNGRIVGVGEAGNFIFIKRARANEIACTGSSGWQAGFDSQVIINCQGTSPDGWVFSSGGSYIEVDGMVHNGIKFDIAWANSDSASHAAIYMPTWAASGHTSLYFKRLEFAGAGTPEWWTQPPWGHKWVSIAAPSGFHNRDIRFIECVWHNMANPFSVVSTHNFLMEGCEMYEIGANGGNAHGNIMIIGADQTNWVFRYNLFRDFSLQSEGFSIGCSSANCTGQDMRDFLWYGNVWRDVGLSGTTGTKALSISANFGVSIINFRFINNTLANHLGSALVFLNNNSPGVVSGGEIRNNIFYIPGGVVQGGLGFWGTHTHNWFSGPDDQGETGSIAAESTDPFVNYAARDLHLVSTISENHPKNKGTPVTYFTTDPDGNLYGGDAAWDMGAYEQPGTASPPVISNVAATPNTNRAMITFNTTTPCTNMVLWDTDGPPYVNATGSVSFVTSHSITISGLTPNTLYHYQPKVGDSAGNTNATPEADRTFMTLAVDDQAPLISGMSPGAGTVLSNTVAVTNAASDAGSGVSLVEWRLDEVFLGSDATAPYTDGVLNTLHFSNGPHTLKFSAVDFTSNWSTQAVALSISNSIGDLMAWWKLDEMSGTNGADASGNALNLLVKGGAVFGLPQGVNGHSLYLDGVNDWACGNSPWFNLRTALTVMAWVRLTNTANWQDLFVKPKDQFNDGASPFHAWSLLAEHQEDGSGFKLRGRLTSATNEASGVFFTTNTFPYNDWMHLAMTFDGTTARIYVNTNLHGEMPFASALMVYSNQPLFLGRQGSPPSDAGEQPPTRLARGAIDEVRVYRTSLTQSNIAFVYMDPPSNITHTVTIQSTHTGIPIVVSQADTNGNQNGTTTFQRHYTNMPMPSFTAPAQNSGSNFTHWLLNGNIATSSTTLQIPMDANHTVEAVYLPPQGPPVGIIQLRFGGTSTVGGGVRTTP